MEIAAKRILIYLEWALFGYALFFILNVFLYEFISFFIALIITVASFLDKGNYAQHAALKQPILEIENDG